MKNREKGDNNSIFFRTAGVYKENKWETSFFISEKDFIQMKKGDFKSFKELLSKKKDKLEREITKLFKEIDEQIKKNKNE